MMTSYCVILLLAGCCWPFGDFFAVNSKLYQAFNHQHWSDVTTDRKVEVSTGTEPFRDKPCIEFVPSENCTSFSRQEPHEDNDLSASSTKSTVAVQKYESLNDKSDKNSETDRKSVNDSTTLGYAGTAGYPTGATTSKSWMVSRTTTIATTTTTTPYSSHHPSNSPEVPEVTAAAAPAQATLSKATTAARSAVTATTAGQRRGKGGYSQRPKSTSETSGATSKQLSGRQMEYLARHFTGFVQNVWLANPTPRAPGPIDDGPFGSILWQDKKYLLSVLIPIALGFTGAMLIIVMAYVSRAYRKRKDRTINTGAPRSFLEAATSKTDDMAPLQESSDDEF